MAHVHRLVVEHDLFARIEDGIVREEMIELVQGARPVFAKDEILLMEGIVKPDGTRRMTEHALRLKVTKVMPANVGFARVRFRVVERYELSGGVEDGTAEDDDSVDS